MGSVKSSWSRGVFVEGVDGDFGAAEVFIGGDAVVADAEAGGVEDVGGAVHGGEFFG